MAASDDDPETCLGTVINDFVDGCDAGSQYDWRYYLVAYSEMREGNSGIYFGVDERLGYEMTMLRKTVQSSYYRDAYLYAIWCQASQPSEVTDPWFYGYSTTPRWMELHRSNVGIRSVAAGIAVRPPSSPAEKAILLEICEAAGATPWDDGWLLRVPQEGLEGERIDTVDRVKLGAGFLKDLISAGL